MVNLLEEIALICIKSVITSPLHHDAEQLQVLVEKGLLVCDYVLR
jgi:hypothetical protein